METWQCGGHNCTSGVIWGSLLVTRPGKSGLCLMLVKLSDCSSQVEFDGSITKGDEMAGIRM